MYRSFDAKQSVRQTKGVLLVESPSSARERHLKTLERNGYLVTTADTVDGGRSRWCPNHFGLVIVAVNGFGKQAADFCDELKDTDSEQVIALIFSPDQDLPATSCATLIFTTEPDEYFLARVETLTAAAYAA
jgi:DNA-binding NtrC family response regulator